MKSFLNNCAMKKINLILCGAAALVFAACAKELAPTNDVEMVQVKIDVTNTVAGKASLVSGKQLKWEVGDKITIVTDDGSAGKLNANAKGYTFTYTGTEASTSGTFAGELPSNVTPLYAIYPATDNFAPVKRNNVYSIDTYEIPTVQYAVKGGIKGEYNISMGNITGSAGSYAVTLESMCSLLKIVIPSDLTDIKDITVCTSLGQPASGLVAPTPDKNFTILNYIPEVSLRSIDGSPLEPGDYYVAVIPTLPSNNNIDDSLINYADSRITFTRTDGIVFTKKFIEKESLLLEPNCVYALNFFEGMNLPLRTRTTVTCTLQAMADALAAGGYTTEAGRTTTDVTVTVDGLDFVLKSYVPKTGYANGWFTETKDGQLRVQNSNMQGSTKKNGYAMIQLPMTNGSAKLTCVKFMTTANNAPFLLSYKIPYDKSPASLEGHTPSLSCPISGTAAYYSFWSSHTTDATELYLASYSGGRNVFNGDIVCTYDVKYKEPTQATEVRVENLGNASDYSF